MKSLTDPSQALAVGLTKIRTEFHVPDGFPPGVVAAAQAAARRAPGQHADRTAMPFVTLDPASSTDLDQAFSIETSGGDLLLHYAIADVTWFVDDGDAVDLEAWNRGQTLYLPDGKAGLYPPVLAEAAASLLPAGPRPAVVFAVRVAGDGAVKLDGAERAIIQSRAKLAYDSVQASDVPAGFAELARRMAANEERRGASRVDPPEQEVEELADGTFRLSFRPLLQSEQDNAALSLAANMAIADAMLAHKTGLFRVMSGPDASKVQRLRNAAQALGLSWPDSTSLRDYQRTLDPTDPKQAALMLEIRRAGNGASYQPYQEGVIPWHEAMAATYAHATAPLRRLADRYVVRCALAIANGQPVPQAVSDAFARLPKVMGRSDARASQINHAAIDLAEAVMLRGHEGETFKAVVTDFVDHGVRVQLADMAVVANVKASGLRQGDALKLKLVSADPDQRSIVFEPAR
ncbi:RNB domain-containing ribonuclease [Mesorhizobium sp. M2D.F.Ca.ET.185.01.1.1]|uniref:RNB domain-containing ribonuclease n=1 Tax=unclassified Mesorhizobium TaxID=325217 RepID=UPI000FCA082B|nr:MULTISPECIES: RNB domain-containing ribonuclease [unclassified Mesorhizobium]TGP80762.1 RNB domain-containing ribonuclease [bacterium M00.F.Ca.ET.227.01.1.1]TGP90546.1 RNB domain-containing ribonuclease [bacterium M00.F.Ca.ET.221.01.1.1]TGP97225.1 RNB domain-containing ribonuclease [bacterium M00.F.Ca.ET.222.01.1.1]TGU02036.1 RNB domain-containing ribonuclease [bacterium M00.F.Ca.ET.163.01.1.1]TGU26095.1 RNB domain-containing ribonuclease [bacterium M00.F.Ca.ET.156.01.1.1]TGU46919.1 RNB do